MCFSEVRIVKDLAGWGGLGMETRNWNLETRNSKMETRNSDCSPRELSRRSKTLRLREEGSSTAGCFLQGQQHTRHTKRAIATLAVMGLLVCLFSPRLKRGDGHISGSRIENDPLCIWGMNGAKPNSSMVRFFLPPIVIGYTDQNPYVGNFYVLSSPAPGNILKEWMNESSAWKYNLSSLRQSRLFWTHEHYLRRFSERVFSPFIHRNGNDWGHLSIGTKTRISAEILKYHRAFQVKADQRWSQGTKFYSSEINAIQTHPRAMFGFPLSFILKVSGLHFIPHLLANVGIVGSRPKSPYCGEKHSNINSYFPPWRLVMTALAGIVGTALGWWGVCRERRFWLSLLVCIISLYIWGYAVYGFLDWSF